MNKYDVFAAFETKNLRSIEMMAREIICSSYSHELIKNLSAFHNEFRAELLKTDQKEKEYLALVYILAEVLDEVHNGSCPCIIVKKKCYNSPSRLKNIFLTVCVNPEPYAEEYKCTCTLCGKEYFAQEQESGFGSRVYWS